MNSSEFQQLIRDRGRDLFRPMPWRQDTRPYYILVSELMLQQTQVDRVIPKFHQFIRQFPDQQALATAPLAQVLTVWQGLGYNRRAKYLQQSAQAVVEHFGGQFPASQKELISLPGVGPNTAGAILAYAFNQPAIFIETNIRTVYIHHFFADDFEISDKQIIDILSKSIDQNNPRQFYWALMDYGSYLKRSGVKNIGQSKHYVKQSPLKGSLREARGIILKHLTKADMDIHDFRHKIALDDRFDVALEGLIKDGLVITDGERLQLAQ